MEYQKQLGNQTIRYWTHHDAQNKTIVLIHGFTGSHKGFNQLLDDLDAYRLIIPDLPGFGVSDLPEQADWTVEGEARLLNEFVASLKLDTPPMIFGHSMGGLVVSAMVHQNPELFSDVVLLSPVPTPIRKNDLRMPGAVLGALQYQIGARTGGVGERLVRSQRITRITTKLMARTKDAETNKFILDNHLENLDFISSIDFYEQLYRDINRRGAVDYADTLRNKRVALIVGDRDNVTPLAEEKKLAEAINPEVFEIIPNVGHLIHYEKPHEATTVIKAFLSRRQSDG